MKYIDYSDKIKLDGNLYGRELIKYCNLHHINKIFSNHDFYSVDVCKSKFKMPKFKIQIKKHRFGTDRLISERKCICSYMDIYCQKMVIGLILDIDLYDSTILNKNDISDFDYKLLAYNDTADECKINN